MSKPTIKVNRTIRSEQVLNVFIQVVCPNLPLDLQNTRITAEDILYVLGYADVHRLSSDSTCQVLHDAPSGNRLREVLVEALPDLAGVQRALNRIFHKQQHPSLLKGKCDYNIAIDLTLISYHGWHYLKSGFTLAAVLPINLGWRYKLTMDGNYGRGAGFSANQASVRSTPSSV